jgi:nucleotide-binding universal stress UspA family protein
MANERGFMMRILFAGDEHHYSEFALKEVVRLAMNTWADVTLLGIVPAASGQETSGGASASAHSPLQPAFNSYRDSFLDAWGNEGSPYALKAWQYEWIPLRNGLWEQLRISRGARKDLKMRLRAGDAASEILAEAREEGVDLIVLGCTKGEQCVWQGGLTVPQKVANDASCSVLLVKEDQPTTRILACFDQTSVSQESLEMINQMATIHQAQLQLVGLSKEGGMKTDAYTRLIELGDYYSDRRIPVATRLVEIAEFANSLAQETRQDLLALWMGKKSLLDVFFPRDWVGRLIGSYPTSVLVLR